MMMNQWDDEHQLLMFIVVMICKKYNWLQEKY